MQHNGMQFHVAIIHQRKLKTAVRSSDTAAKGLAPGTIWTGPFKNEAREARSAEPFLLGFPRRKNSPYWIAYYEGRVP